MTSIEVICILSHFRDVLLQLNARVVNAWRVEQKGEKGENEDYKRLCNLRIVFYLFCKISFSTLFLSVCVWRARNHINLLKTNFFESFDNLER